jgi:hypothetical protein
LSPGWFRRHFSSVALRFKKRSGGNQDEPFRPEWFAKPPALFASPPPNNQFSHPQVHKAKLTTRESILRLKVHGWIGSLSFQLGKNPPGAKYFQDYRLTWCL